MQTVLKSLKTCKNLKNFNSLKQSQLSKFKFSSLKGQDPTKDEVFIQKTFDLQVQALEDLKRHYGPLMDLNLSYSNLTNQYTKVQHFINVYRRYGHYFADVDPLKKLKRKQEFINPLDLGLSYKEDILQEIDEHSSHIKNEIKNLEELEHKLRQVYTGSVGVEFNHVFDKTEKSWLYKNYERNALQKISQSEKRNIFSILTQTEALDHYLHKKYSTFKRYSGEGVESMISGLKTLLAKASELGVEECVIGMPHRGRLNTICSIMDYPVEQLFNKIEGNNDMPEEYYNACDDVVSHIALSKKKSFIGMGCKESPINVSLLHNPSHLELINPASQGKTRAKQDAAQNKKKILNVQFHGDAAFTGQGVVYESFALNGVPKYRIGGSIHIIVNNQIGYTTSVKDSRGSLYASDLGKMHHIPVVHCNANDPEAVHRIMKFAVEYRQTFEKDIIIDLIGFRKYGHNELDEPEFTQPRLYKHIKKIQKSIPQAYFEHLKAQNIVKEDGYESLREKVFKHLENQYNSRKKNEGKKLEDYISEKQQGQKAFTEKWKNMVFSTFGKSDAEVKTGLKANYLKQLGKQSVTIPNDFKVHSRLKKYFIEDRLKQIDSDNIDWATAEAIAVGSLLKQSYNVRISGEDVERGTFSQRHFVLVDQETEEEWNPLKELSEGMNQGHLSVCNSPLSESAVLTYEYGYSIENPNNLTIWEAQFGDFFNPAQSTYDSIILASEEKWARQTGLVTILPHGFDGAGPEHSSCKIERFLQMGNTDGINRNWERKEHDKNRKQLEIGDNFFYSDARDVNFCVVQPTTPANYFHVLRRQMLRNYRKPLVIAGPKTLLRHPQCKSSFKDMDEGTQFQPVLIRQQVNKDTKTIILCSGKISYTLMKQIENKPNIALLVLDELLPFPEEILKQQIQQANPEQTKIIWVQEEHINKGAFSFAEPHVFRILNQLKFKENQLQYIGRRSLASPATGIPKKHKLQDQLILEELNKYI
ncbi:hypothetical protein PPERSA_10279 [Pseudocohnilembus persalinus]|uniref:Transketolase-like pyrimidine-binding domain-containing protein n=1 Tax=Pseudocohnilembus persalinus TaxID=266149 RepID=A0A0V0R050_PSEPJ|nr:hypothetical protein PPERSA_10279 [Pseudocohnilembus persalinus]|eukprot:KRX07891.1 hypothetical protein PPERSA_10279 [Pseudocohnilembus persalinus]